MSWINLPGYSSKKLAPTERPSIHDICWAAGVFEGEGSVHKQTGQVKVAQKDRWILDRLCALFGGSIHMIGQSGRARLYSRDGIQYNVCNDIFVWILSGPRSRGFLMTVYKFLSPRRQEQARIGLTASPRLRIYRRAILNVIVEDGNLVCDF